MTIVDSAVAKFFCNGGHYRECRSKDLQCGRVEGFPPPESKFGGMETLFSALVMRCVSEKLTSNVKMAKNCKSL